MTRYEDTLEHKIRCLPIFGTNKLLLTDVIDTVREHNQAATTSAEAKYLPVIEKASALCDQMARDGYQNAKLEAVRELREALVALATPLLKGESR